MTDFELQDLGSGSFRLSGEMSFDTADRIMRASEQAFASYDDLRVDCAGVTKADSAGLALLLEWKTLAHNRRGRISFSGLPDSIVAIARTTEVDHLL